MARIRTIKPEFWEDEKLSNVSEISLLIFIGSWNFADDEGVLTANAKLLKSKIFPLRDYGMKVFENSLNELIKNKQLIPFSYDNNNYLLIKNFRKHQKISKPQQSKIPNEVIENILQEYSGNVPGMVQECSGNGSGGKGKERKGNGKEMEKDCKDVKNIEIIYPFISNYFMDWWEVWKKYKKEQHKFTYKSVISEQAALKELNNLAGGIEETAVNIIEQSIANGYKGFFELKNTKRKNGQISNDYKQRVINEALGYEK